MILKSIELFGFKSFADRSRIEFTDGISALLGPNGCGKSNIVDGIKWVLGEQSTKTLRAGKMEDVIFNGTENRKPLNVAEVSLVLSNVEGLLPIDMPELSIKRRVFRSGESEYYINGKPAKLREIRELFFDTGIGKTAYSIMEQGKIDQILSSKPEERRFLFEEAAGITKYKAKGAEAERKLERTEENMRQVQGILGEVSRSYESLKKQAEKTTQYREFQDSQFALEIDIQLLRLKEYLQKQDTVSTDLESRQKQRDTLKKKIDAVNEILEQNLDQVNAMESHLVETQKKLYGIDLEKSGREKQVAILRERRNEVHNQSEAAKARIESVKTKITSLDLQIEERNLTLNEVVTGLKEIEKNIESFTQRIEHAQDRIRNNERTITTLDNQIALLEKEGVTSQDELRELTDNIVSELDMRLKETGYSSRDRKDVEEELQHRIENLKIHIAGKTRFFGDVSRLSEHGSSDIKKIMDDGVEEYRRLNDALEEIERLFSEYRGKIPAFIDEFLAPKGTITRKRELDVRIEEIRTNINANRDSIVKLREENRVLSEKIEEYRNTLEELRITKARMLTQKTALEETIVRLNEEKQEQDAQIIEAEEIVFSCRVRIDEIDKRVVTLQEEIGTLVAEEETLKENLTTLESGISEKNKDLLSKENQLKTMMDDLGGAQERVERTQIELTTIRTDIRNIYDNFRERYSRELSEYESRMFEIRTQLSDLRSQLAEVRRLQKELGHVNLMAPEEFAEVKERYDFLNAQLEDLIKAREDLRSITAQIRTESTELFLETYEKIKRNFHVMFRRLFGGGRAELRLEEPDKVLESGVEILAQPPGKKLESIALLSGGERSLTAVGLLFATYMVRPSPFCILDEIDAALDEANVGRFITLLQEFGARSQFVVITHNKKTVAGAKSLIGITMEESGISKIITVRLESDEE